MTTPIRTLVDLATGLLRAELEAAANEADRLDLVNPERLRLALDDQHGARALRALLDRRTFTLRTPSSSGASCRSSGAPVYGTRSPSAG